MMKLSRVVILCALFCCCGALQAQENLGDYDGDQLDDISVVSVNSEAKTTSWVALSSKTKLPVYTAAFGVPGDALVAGRFFPESIRTYPGVVYVRDARKPLEWYLKTPSGGEMMLEFGSPGDMIPNQMDLDCDGITDLVVARTRNTGELKGFNFWYMRLSSKNFQVYETMFGLAGDKMWVADLDRDGCGELVALRKGFTWYSRKPLGTKMSTVQWGLDGDIPIAPHDMTRDRRPEYIIVRPYGSGHLAYIRDGKSPHKTTTIKLGTTGTIPMIGKFLEYLNLAWIDRANSTIVVRKKNGSQIAFPTVLMGSLSVVRPDGTVITPTADGTFGMSQTPSSTGGNQCVRTGGPTNFIGDGYHTGLLWRPADTRPNRIVMMFPKEISPTILRSKLTIFGASGNDLTGSLADTLPCANGCRVNIFPTTSLGTYIKNAPITVRVQFPDQKTTWCLEVKNPAVRND